MSDKPKRKRDAKPKNQISKTSPAFRAVLVFLILAIVVGWGLLAAWFQNRPPSNLELTATILARGNGTTWMMMRQTETQSAIDFNNTQVAATFIASNPSSTPCPFTWGTSEDLQGAVRLTSYLVEQGYEVAVTVPAYGEYACEDFMLMDTSPRVTLVVDDLDDEVALGTIVRDVLLAIEAVEITRPREVTIVFTLEGTEESVSWSVAYSDAIQLSIGSFRRLFRSGITLESD